MVRMTSRMSTPAREVVEKAAVWWRDSGAAEKLPEKKSYSVDAWGRRRGGSTQGACHVFRYDLSALPVRVKASLAEKQKTDMSGFACQWCGGPPSAHQDVGAANEEELRQQRAVALMAKAQLAAEEMKANTAQELKALADVESRDTLEAGQVVPGSYVQKDCPWMPGLKALGASRQEQDALLQSLRLELQSEELRRWAGSCDLVALQEVDTSLRQALGGERLARGRPGCACGLPGGAAAAGGLQAPRGANGSLSTPGALEKWARPCGAGPRGGCDVERRPKPCCVLGALAPTYHKLRGCIRGVPGSAERDAA
ncbi:unnamed protein product [Effrenium voratum]|nr:unnamed protein product [Effrenium voratum]